MMDFAVPFASGLAVSAAVTPLVRAAAWRGQLVSRPRDDRWHQRPVALLGGIAVWAAVMAALVASGVTGASAWWLAGTGTASFIVGITDDLIRLKPSTKLTSQIGIACSLLAAGWSLTWTDAEPLNVISVRMM